MLFIVNTHPCKSISSNIPHLPGLQEKAHLGLQCTQGHVHIRIQILTVQRLQRVKHPVLAVPRPPMAHHRHECHVCHQVVEPVGGDVPNDVPAPPVARLVQRDVEAVLSRIRLGVADDFVSVAAFFRGADDDSPV